MSLIKKNFETMSHQVIVNPNFLPNICCSNVIFFQMENEIKTVVEKTVLFARSSCTRSVKTYVWLGILENVIGP